MATTSSAVNTSASVNTMTELQKKERFNQLMALAHGRWVEIYKHTIGFDFSIAADNIMSNGKGLKVQCPMCANETQSGKKHFRVLKNFNENGAFLCDKCGIFPSFGIALERINNWSFQTSCKEIAKFLNANYIPGADIKHPVAKEKRKVEPKVNNYVRKIVEDMWKTSKPVSGTIVEKYFRDQRGITCDLPNEGVLRYQPRMEYGESDENNNYKKVGVYPGWVAMISSPQEGTPLSLHRGYLNQYGKKANVSEPRKQMKCVVEGSISKLGAVIRLRDTGKDCLALGEGVETTLSIMSAFPTLDAYSTINAVNMLLFRPPKHVKKIVIFADLDASGTGQIKASVAALKLESLGYEVEIYIPAPYGRVFIPPKEVLERKGWVNTKYSYAAVCARIVCAGYQLTEVRCADVDWNDLWLIDPGIVTDLGLR